MAQDTAYPDIRPSEELSCLLDQLQDEAVDDAGMRYAKRRAIHAPITLGVMAGSYKPLYRGWATDLSLNGIGILTEHDIPMDATLLVNLEAIVAAELLLPIRVCYVRQLMSKTYRIGGTFEFPSDPDRESLLF